MNEPQRISPYRNSEAQDAPEPTRTVSDWEAFRTGIGRVLIFPAAVFGGLLFFFWLAIVAAVMDVLRYAVFRAVEVGHSELGVKNQRRFHSYLYGSVVDYFDTVAEGARLVELVHFLSIASWLLSVVAWSAAAGVLASAGYGGDLAAGGCVGGFLGAVIFAFGALPMAED